ncbi:mechanosensitive ion channel family protein [Myxococcus stipitatus]|uniref:mechanosensitive ion channel family protein n=1 Tax=Myxococcus stipitatus TaxID=83455 RepID=UPI001F1838C5|nr:mechanosensitive ion channel family protein [Myxococcus stipitatus]MCE9667024.1 mechanosensitive ion channel family protein [Myxococcus stipitatus]
MLPFLQSNLSLAVGALLVLVLLGARAASHDADLKRDLTGALRLLVMFLVVRVAAWALPATTPPGPMKALQVAWMLTFAFGVIRAGVGFGLKLARLRSTSVATPKILRNVIDFLLYTMAAVPILQTQLNLDLTGLVATSAVLSVVIGLALQETLGNLFAGLSLQLDKPFEVGDFIRIGEHTGRVAQVNWRSIRIMTFRRELVTLPNSMVAKEQLKTFSQDREPVGVDAQVRASYDTPPNVMKAALLDVAREIPQVLVEPPPIARTLAFDESCVRYMVRFYVNDFSLADAVTEELYTRLWYRLRRDGVEPPLPQRVLRGRDDGPRPELPVDTVLRLLRAVDLFRPLSDTDLERLGKEVHVRRFGRDEHIIQEGDEGRTFYVLASGEVSVRAGKGQAEVTRLGQGGYFGEMSLLTGERRAATVVALQDSLLLEVDRPTFARLFAENPGLARQLSALLAHRRTQLLALAQASGGHADPLPAEVGRILGRLRQIFGLHASHD